MVINEEKNKINNVRKSISFMLAIFSIVEVVKLLILIAMVGACPELFSHHVMHVYFVSHNFYIVFL